MSHMIDSKLAVREIDSRPNSLSMERGKIFQRDLEMQEVANRSTGVLECSIRATKPDLSIRFKLYCRADGENSSRLTKQSATSGVIPD